MKTTPPVTNIPFNRPFLTGRELANVQEALTTRHLSGDGTFTKACNAWMEKNTGCHRALLTHSCTAALEMAAILLDLKPGDEVILPSFTFVSTANAIVLRGATPVFVDIRADTLNLDETLVEKAITPRTRGIFVVHYAGVSAEMDPILEIAKKHNILVVEDAAQGIMATYKGRALGSMGALGCLSFHETKSLVSGEGGALLINDPALAHRSEIIREKGTNRSQFFRGQVDKYTWVDVGSSYLPSELIAAVLLAQLEEGEGIQRARHALWEVYHAGLESLERAGHIRRPVIPAHVQHNAHMYYVLCRSLDERTRLIAHMKTRGINPAFHYVPLHSAPAGIKFGKTPMPMPVTDKTGETLVRLPMWAGLDDAQRVLHAVTTFFAS
jgi:dTDP-4-amino-4,6-dideoxygalactose transaminase